MIQAFHRPTTVEQALQLKARLADSAVFLAGGTGVNCKDFPFEPEHVISLDALFDRWGGVESTGAGLRLGAGVCLQDLLEHPDIPELLRQGIGRIRNRTIRNMATLGGHLATGKSCSDLIPALLVLEAELEALSLDGQPRRISLERYVAAPEPWLLTALFLPPLPPGFTGASHTFTRTANDLSILTAAAALRCEGESVVGVRIAVGGVAPHVRRLSTLEQSLQGAPLPSRDALESRVRSQVQPRDDARGSARYKRRVAGVLVARALHTAHRAERAREVQS